MLCNLSKENLNGTVGYIVDKQPAQRWGALSSSLGKNISIHERNLNILSEDEVQALDFSEAEEKLILDERAEWWAKMEAGNDGNVDAIFKSILSPAFSPASADVTQCK